MIEPETLTLDWHGPIVPMAYEAPSDADALQVPSVYIYEIGFDKVTAIYVGQTKNFIDRMYQHITAMLGLTYWLRNDRGSYGDGAYAPKARHHFIEDLKNVRHHQAMAADSLARMTWYHAPVEPYALVHAEGMLIRRVKQLELHAVSSDVPLMCENGNLGRAPVGAAIIKNKGAARPCDLLGDHITWPLEDTACAMPT
jgi:hypothetical protein